MKIIFAALIRYCYTILWILLLVFFSYSELFFNFFDPNAISFNDKLIDMLNSRSIILSNTGLVTILYIDSLIIKKVINVYSRENFYGLLFCSLVMVIVLTVFAEAIYEGKMQLPTGMHLSYLFYLFILFLTIYKAESLNIKHHSSTILKSQL